MKRILVFILIVAVVGVVTWWVTSSEPSSASFSTRQLSDKVVYNLIDGSVADLKNDCRQRGGWFNECGSMCEAGEICALVCAYTCEFTPLKNTEEPTQNDTEFTDSDSGIECGIINGETKQCPAGETCFVYQESSPTCSSDPCQVCDAPDQCLILESYPVRVVCEGDVETEPVKDPDGAVSIDNEDVTEGEIIETEPLIKNITVTSPQPHETVSSPITVAGQARVFEGTVLIRIKNKESAVLIEEVATAKAPDVGQFGPYSIKINYSFSATKEGFVEVYSESARDGSEENLVSIPVKFE